VTFPEIYQRKVSCVNDVSLLELMSSSGIRGSIRKARESFYIDKAKTMQPHGINKDDY